MNTYPTTVIEGSTNGWFESLSDGTVDKELYSSGHPFTIQQRTFDPETFEHILPDVSDAGKDTLDTFYQNNKKVSFWWLHPGRLVYYDVTYVERPEFIANDDIDSWRVVQKFTQFTSLIVDFGLDGPSMFIPPQNIFEISGSPERTPKLSIRGDGYKWTVSGSGTGEYYLTLAAGGDPSIAATPQSAYEDGFALTSGALGSLAAEEWNYGDNDSLGYSTIYVRLADDADPDSKVVDYVEYLDAFPTEMWRMPYNVDSQLGFSVITPDVWTAGTYKIRSQVSYTGQKSTGSYITSIGLEALAVEDDIRTGSVSAFTLTVPSTNYQLLQSAVEDSLLLSFSSGNVIKGVFKRDGDDSSDVHEQGLYILGFKLTLEKQ